jgi:hypothetical protein
MSGKQLHTEMHMEPDILKLKDFHRNVCTHGRNLTLDQRLSPNYYHDRDLVREAMMTMQASLEIPDGDMRPSHSWRMRPGSHEGDTG